MSSKDNDTIGKYADYIKTQLTRLGITHFTGNIEFKVNFKEGHISHINDSQNKSVVLRVN